MYMHALEGYRRIGDDWYGTLDTVRKIAQVLAKQRKLWQAAGLVEQVYQFGIDHYRPKSAFTLTDTQCYAHILWELRQYGQAIVLMRSCVMVLCQLLGRNHRFAVENARLVAEWEQAELERKVKRSEIRLMWILFWPFFGDKVP